MKYLTNYTEAGITKALKDHGGFFAFSDKQFDSQKQENVEYVHMGQGLIAPKDKAQSLFEAMDKVYEAGIKQDLEENGREGVIQRELGNYECYYTGDIDQCVYALESYGITKKEIAEVYKKHWKDETINL